MRRADPLEELQKIKEEYLKHTCDNRLNLYEDCQFKCIEKALKEAKAKDTRLKLVEAEFISGERILLNTEDISYCNLVTQRYTLPKYDVEEVDWLHVHLKTGQDITLTNGKQIYDEIKRFGW